MARQLQASVQMAQRFDIIDRHGRRVGRAFCTAVHKKSKHASTQKWIAQSLHPRLALCGSDAILRKRMCRLVMLNSDQTLPEGIVERMRHVEKTLRNKAPICVIAAAWKAWLNGRCAARRFQGTRPVPPLFHVHWGRFR